MAEVAYKKSTAREYFESLVITVILALFGQRLADEGDLTRRADRPRCDFALIDLDLV